MIKVFGKEGCSKCDSLKKTLDNRGIEYEYSRFKNFNDCSQQK